MASDPWIETALRWGFWGIAMTLVMGWLGRTRLRTRSSRPGTMQMPVSIFIVMLICFTAFCTFAVLSSAAAFFTTAPNKPAPLWVPAIFVFFAALCLPVISSFFFEKHTLSDQGLEFRNFVGVRKRVNWDELSSVRYSAVLKWFRLETRTGVVARVSVALTGLPEFAGYVLSAKGTPIIDPQSMAVLQATAAGHPPSLYQ